MFMFVIVIMIVFIYHPSTTHEWQANGKPAASPDANGWP
jgi:hypothetical protein